MSNQTPTTTDEQSETSPASLSEAPIQMAGDDVEVRDFDAVDDDHPLVQYAGTRARKTDVTGGGKFIAEAIYENDSAWVREWLQNAETACIRAAKLLIQLSDEYPEGWLSITKYVDEDGNTVDQSDNPSRQFKVSRPVDEILDAARNLGYDPTIEWSVYHDERRIITEDNGIGMTAREFWEAFESPGNSGAGVDGNTGGQFGRGSESVRIVYGDEGGAEVESRSRRPGDHGGYRAYTYAGGATAIPGELDDSFRGTRFLIPAQQSFNLDKVQGWVEDYTEMLRVPMKYDEYDAGSNPVDEEYEASRFVEEYQDAPVLVERPGEFSVVAGPDVYDTGYKSDDENTFLVSMPIDRNTSVNIRTLWNTVIQIHDEQGRIVSGPNRGKYRDEVTELHEDDVVLPEPTGDRDRLGSDSASKDFFNYIEDIVESKELERTSEITDEMQNADHPADPIRGDSSKWELLRKMVDYHGGYRVFESTRKVRNFFQSNDHFPDFDNEVEKKVAKLFEEIQHCHNGASRSSKKRSRSEKMLGEILSEYEDAEVYMAASTGGNFTDRFKVIEDTHGSNAEVIVIGRANHYDIWSKHFDFKILKEVPLQQSDDHEYVISDHIDDKHDKSNKGLPDKVKDRELKIRSDSDNSSIDHRTSIENAKNRLDGGGFNGHDKLVVFRRSDDEKISDNYKVSRFAAIASVSKKEYAKLEDHDQVLTFSEFKERSESTLIATEDGAMTPKELVEDDRMVVLTYVHDKEVLQLLSEDFEKLRSLYAKDVRDQVDWCSKLDGYDGGYRGDDPEDVDDADKHDTLFGVADETVMKRSKYAFWNLWMEDGFGDTDIVQLRLTHQYGSLPHVTLTDLDKTTFHHRLVADTPKWEDNSSVYDLFPNNRDNWKAQVLLGFHDQGIDPTKKDNDTLRDLIGDD